MSYEWIEEINELIQTLKGKMNNIKTRQEITKETIKILRHHKVVATIDCSTNVNTPDVINHGDFVMQVETKQISILFRCKQKELLV